MIPGWVGYVLDGIDKTPMDLSCAVHLDVRYRPETFTAPPSVAAGPYAWKPKAGGSESAPSKTPEAAQR